MGEGGNKLVVAVSEEPGIVVLEYRDREDVMKDQSVLKAPCADSQSQQPRAPSLCEGTPSGKPKERHDLEHGTVSFWACFPQ